MYRWCGPPVLITYCVASAAHKRAAIDIIERRILITDDGGAPRRNPSFVILDHQAQIIMRTAGELGFTPISRAQIGRAISASNMPGGGGPLLNQAKAGELEEYLGEKPDRLDG